MMGLLRKAAHARAARRDACSGVNADESVPCRRQKSWRDGTTHIAMSPLALMQRLAAPVPRPRLHGQMSDPN